jgi:hypothetical protein
VSAWELLRQLHGRPRPIGHLNPAYKRSWDGVVKGNDRQILYTILSGQTRARGLYISANRTVENIGRGVSTLTSVGNKGSPSEAKADSKARKLSPMSPTFTGIAASGGSGG